MFNINKVLLDQLIEQARNSARKRKNFNFHETPLDPLHRMLHAMQPETYVQPHKHENPDKREAFIILKGKIAAIQYNDSGKVIEYVILDPEAGNFGVEFPPRTWHSLIVLEIDSVIYEVKDGPWDPSDDKFFAPWAPKEGDPECSAFNLMVLRKIGF